MYNLKVKPSAYVTIPLSGLATIDLAEKDAQRRTLSLRTGVSVTKGQSFMTASWWPVS